MKTIVLDDDPTGTQSASGITVLLDYDAASIIEALRTSDSIYVQTNSRAIDEAAAVALVISVRDAAEAAGRALGHEIQFVLRGDSTLRGHVFVETDQFVGNDSVIVFSPAFPAGGRTTIDGVHLVDGVAAHLTEYADDPVFPFETAILVDYVAEKSDRLGIGVSLQDVRASRVENVIATAPAGAVIVPDAETDDDIRMIAAGIEHARRAGRSVVVRSAAPLAAALADVQSDGLLPQPLVPTRVPTLVACGSHTTGATAQLAAAEEKYGPVVVIATDDAMADPVAAGLAAADIAREQIRATGIGMISTERSRRADHNTLAHGEMVMTALTTAVRALVPDVEAVVAKGGITSAELARTAIGSKTAFVRGQVVAGVSVWDLVSDGGQERLYVVVPGNVGGPNTIVDVLGALGY